MIEEVKKMYVNEPLTLQTLSQNNVYEVTQIEAQQDAAQVNGISAPHVAIALGSLGLFMIFTVIFIAISKFRAIAPNELFLKFKRSHQIPCRNCRYFSGNFYLRCAVHPSNVLTEKAVDCADYRSQEEQSEP
jgi:hypothetical protein